MSPGSLSREFRQFTAAQYCEWHCMRVEVEAFYDDAIACKDTIQAETNYKPGGATFGAGTKTPIGARLVTYL